jgi:hypothetical protein
VIEVVQELKAVLSAREIQDESVQSLTMRFPAFQPLPLDRARVPFSHPDWLFEIKTDAFRAPKMGSNQERRHPMQRTLLALNVVLASLTCASALGQAKGVAVQVLNRDANQCRLFNQSGKTISSFSIAIAVTYGDGATTQGGADRRVPIQPGASLDFDCNITEPAHGNIVDVQLTPSLVIYADGTQEVTDAKTYKRVMWPWIAQREALQVALKAVQQSLSDGSDPKPAIEDALKQSRPHPGAKRVDLSKPIAPDDDTLQHVLADLQKVSTHDDLVKYAAKLQSRLQKPLNIGGS